MPDRKNERDGLKTVDLPLRWTRLIGPGPDSSNDSIVWRTLVSDGVMDQKFEAGYKIGKGSRMQGYEMMR